MCYVGTCRQVTIAVRRGLMGLRFCARLGPVILGINGACRRRVTLSGPPAAPPAARWRRPGVVGVVLCVIAGMALLVLLDDTLTEQGPRGALVLVFLLFPVSGLMLIVFAWRSKDGRLTKERWVIASVPFMAAMFLAAVYIAIDKGIGGPDFDYGRARAQYDFAVEDAYERAEAGELTPDELVAELRAVEGRWDVARAEYRKATVLVHEDTARAKALGLMLEGHDRVAAAEWAADNSWSSRGYYELTLGRAADAKRQAFELMDVAVATYQNLEKQDLRGLYVDYEIAADRRWAAGVKWAAAAVAYEQAAAEMADAAVGVDGSIERLAAFGWSAEEWEGRAERSGSSAVIRDGYTVSQCAAAAIAYARMAADMSDVVRGDAHEHAWEMFDMYAAWTFDC